MRCFYVFYQTKNNLLIRKLPISTADGCIFSEYDFISSVAKGQGLQVSDVAITHWIEMNEKDWRDFAR